MAAEPTYSDYRLLFPADGPTLDYRDDVVDKLYAKRLSRDGQTYIQIYAEWFRDENGQGGAHTVLIFRDNLDSWEEAVYDLSLMRRGINWQQLIEPYRAMFAPELPPLSQADELRLLRLENEALRARLAAAEEVAMLAVNKDAYAAKLEEQMRDASNRLQGVRAVISCAGMDPTDRIVGLATLLHAEGRENIKKHTDPELGVRVKRGDVARMAAVSEDRVTKAWSKFTEAGAWERSETSWWNEAEGHTETNVWFRMDGSPVDRLFSMATLELPRKQGGKRTPRAKVFCENCGEAHIERKAYTECQGCGHKWDKQSYDVNERIERENERIERGTLLAADTSTDRETLLASQDNLNSLETLLAAHTPADIAPEPVPERQRRLPLVQRVTPAGEGVEDIVLPPAPPTKRPKHRVRHATGDRSQRFYGYAAGGAD